MAEYATKVETLTASVAALKAGDPDPNAIAIAKGDIEPPQVVTATGVTQTGPKTELEAQEVAKIYFNGNVPTMEMLYRAVETKQLPSSVLPGLEGMPREEKPTP